MTSSGIASLVNAGRQVGKIGARDEPVSDTVRKRSSFRRVVVLAMTHRERGRIFLHVRRGRRVHNAFEKHIVPLVHDSISVDRVDGMTDLHRDCLGPRRVSVLGSVGILIDAIEHPIGAWRDRDGNGCREGQVLSLQVIAIDRECGG